MICCDNCGSIDGCYCQVIVTMICVVRWEDEDEMLEKQVSAAERLNKYWLAYEKDCEEAEMSINRMESELDAVVVDTEPDHLHTCLDRLQVCTESL